MSNTKDIVLSGIQPSGPLHLGNYLGALKNFIKIQSEYAHCYFFIADLHSITEDFDPKTKAQQTIELAAEYLAAGLDPNKSTIFVQSHVPECTQLSWIFTTLTPVPFLERMTQYKDKALRQKKNINAGLFTYPILQAADILLYHANLVPVGEDQIQHVEITRDLAKFFNNKFGQYFPEPKPLLTKVPRIMSLKNPERKMSKSETGSFVNIDMEPAEILAIIKKANTTPAGVNNLKEILAEFKECIPVNFKFDPNNNQTNKEVLTQVIADAFTNFRAKKKELMAKPDAIKKILEQGAAKARVVAQKTIKEVRDKIGLLN